MVSRNNKKNVDNAAENKKALQEAADIQAETQAALQRIQQQAAETEELGATTLEELQEQRQKMDNILEAGDELHAHLDKTEKLQNKLSRWSLFFNRKAARRDANKEAEKVETSNKVSSKRQARMAMTEADSLVPVRKDESTARKGKRPTNKNKKNGGGDDMPVDHKKGLMYGVGAIDEENMDELNALADTDAAIDSTMDSVSAQLDSLVGMSKSIGSEVKTQSKGVDEIHDQIESANYKQKVVSNRGRRFMTGKLRRENEKEKELGGSALLKVATKALS